MNASRPPPPQGAPPSYAFVTRMYTRNLRPVVIATAALSAMWTGLGSIAAFRSAGIDKGQHVPELANISYALGALYLAVAIIEVFGILAASSQRLALIRLYAFASTISVLMVVTAGILATVTHFQHKHDLINECTTLTTGDQVIYRYGLFGPTSHDTLNSQDAAQWCNDEWNHDSWSFIVSILIELALGVLFSSIAFAYYHQMLDPTSAANATRAPSARARVDGFPSHYNPPYNASVPNLSYDAPAYAPPPGPPPHLDDSKPPGYAYGSGPDYGSDGKFVGGDGKRDLDTKDDPFADFDGPSQKGHDHV